MACPLLRRIIGFYIVLFITLSSNEALAQATQDITVATTLIEWIKAGLEIIVATLTSILFYPVFGFPLLVLWLAIGGLFFTFRLGFINIRFFGHAIQIVRGKYSTGNEPGEVSHFQALVAAVSGTVGLGNIAGVAIAVSLGGPGAVIWMVIAGLFGMSAKFAEVTLGQKYRKINKQGKVSGGAFLYLKHGLAEMGQKKLGNILAVIFAALCIMGSFGGGNMFQSNQAVAIMTDSFPLFKNMDWMIAFIMAFSVGIVLIGGIKRIALVAEAVVPLMALIYMTAAFIVIAVHHERLPEAITTMITNAFNGAAVGGGMVGAIINGLKRAVFSNEAGLGSAPIAHSAAKTDEPVREGFVALLEPFIDTVIICFTTGLVITLTGVYEGAESSNGVLLTSEAFATVIDWFPVVLSIAVILFAYSTMITWSYYGERCWAFLFGNKTIGLYHITFCLCVFLGGVIQDISLIVNFSDVLMLSMALPNLIGMYILSGIVKQELDHYTTRLRAGVFKIYQK